MAAYRRFLCLAIALVACDASDDDDDGGPAGPRQFVGRVSGSETFVGIVLDDTEVFAYACDGTPASITVSSWLVGTVDGNAFSADNPSGASLGGQLDGDGIEGTFTPSTGTAAAFTASVAAPPSGLYFGERGEDTEEIWGGWIVIGSEQRGAVVDRTTGDVVGSPSIDPAAPSVDVEGDPLEYEDVDAPLGEDVDEVPPG